MHEQFSSKPTSGYEASADVDQTRDGQIIDQLKTDPELKDDSGLPRPLFTIAGRDVVFRNRQETPTIAGRDIYVAGDVAPVRIGAKPESEYQKMLSYNDQRQADSEQAVIVVTNTPLGIVEAALELTDDTILGEWLEQVGEKMKSKQYNEESVQECIDYILAAISIDEDGMDVNSLDSDGFAVSLAALSGDAEAAAVVESRRQALLRNDMDRKAENYEMGREDLRDYEARGVEPLPLERMALVHTTAHEPEMSDQGEVLLRPAAQRREDELPRSTLHFTINSRVEVNAEAEDAWKIGDRMIVANLGHVVESNHGRLPEVLNGVDSYYSLNPGESLALDNASIVEAIQGDDTAVHNSLVMVHGNNIKYVLKSPDEYTAAEKTEIDTLANQVHIRSDLIPAYDKLLQEVALRTALQKQGIAFEDMDTPSPNGHGMHSHKLAGKIFATAASLGMGVATHFNQPHSRAEREMYAGMSQEYVGELSPKMVEATGSTNYIDAGLEMRRQQLVSGALPARPLAYKKNSTYAVPTFAGGSF